MTNLSNNTTTQLNNDHLEHQSPSSPSSSTRITPLRQSICPQLLVPDNGQQQSTDTTIQQRMFQQHSFVWMDIKRDSARIVADGDVDDFVQQQRRQTDNNNIGLDAISTRGNMETSNVMTQTMNDDTETREDHVRTTTNNKAYTDWLWCSMENLQEEVSAVSLERCASSITQTFNNDPTWTSEQGNSEERQHDNDNDDSTFWRAAFHGDFTRLTSINVLDSINLAYSTSLDDMIGEGDRSQDLSVRTGALMPTVKPVRIMRR